MKSQNFLIIFIFSSSLLRTIYCLISQKENFQSQGIVADLIHAFHNIIYHTIFCLLPLVEGCKRRVDFNSFLEQTITATTKFYVLPVNINEKKKIGTQNAGLFHVRKFTIHNFFFVWTKWKIDWLNNKKENTVQRINSISIEFAFLFITFIDIFLYHEHKEKNAERWKFHHGSRSKNVALIYYWLYNGSITWELIYWWLQSLLLPLLAIESLRKIWSNNFLYILDFIFFYFSSLF